MSRFDLYSKRQKRSKGEVPEVYIYDSIPYDLRVKIVFIIRDLIGRGKYDNSRTEGAYKTIHNLLCREYGKFVLNDYSSYEQKVVNFLLETQNTDEALDIIELLFYTMGVISEKHFDEYRRNVNVKMTLKEAIGELNYRFQEHGIGYQFEQKEIIKVDSQYMHAEVVKTVLLLLSSEKFIGASDEFLKAHEHYRHGRNKECLNDCLKAFESTLKIICGEKEWHFNDSDTARKLIQICFENGLVPSFTQNQFSSLQNLLLSGIPTIRNKLGGHGQGQVPQKVDDGMTRYALNLTGANIIFLIEQSGIIE